MAIITKTNALSSKKKVIEGLGRVKSVAHSYLALEDDNFIDFSLAVVIANRFDGEPLFGGLIAPPASAKTEILRAFDGHSCIQMLSNITPQTLISGWSTKKGNQSLLPRINGKVLVIKEFTTILHKRYEARAEILAQFREMYDGRVTGSYGTGETVDWTGKVGILFAVTPVIDSHLPFMQALGERFVYYRIYDENDAAIADCALENALGESGHRKALRTAVHAFLNCFEARIEPRVDVDENVKAGLRALSILTVKARTSIPRDRYNKSEITLLPSPEHPARIIKQLTLLGLGLSTIRGVDCIDAGVYDIVKKVAHDTIPPLRHRILSTVFEMYSEKNEWSTIRDIEERSGIPSSTQRYHLEDLRMLGLLDSKRDGSNATSKLLYQPSDEMVEWVTASKAYA
ncbi:winged helix-turn-helix domain-containing protein, partial [Candidatus Latescibacterota bacterium]